MNHLSMNRPLTGKRRVCCHNTALYELRLLAKLLDEAKLRGYCQDNPCRSLQIRKEPPKVKPEILEADIQLIRARLKSEPEWMRVSFEIAIHHGTRLRATSVSLASDIDEGFRSITFHEKGQKVFTVPLHPKLVPLIMRLKAAGQARTCDIPMDASKQWTRFFRQIGRPKYCFHCTRVTVITRLCRSGVPEAKAMKFVGHSSTLIHRVYQRLRSDDLCCCHLDQGSVTELGMESKPALPFNQPPVLQSPPDDSCATHRLSSDGSLEPPKAA